MLETIELWEDMKFEVGTIGNNLISKDKQEVLIGMGNRNAKMLFVGNDPDLYLSEDYKVKSSSSGEFLLKLLDIVEIFPDMYYITTLSKRDVKFKNFVDEDRKKLLDILYMQIALINPKVLILLGKDVAQIVLNKNIDFDKEQGKFEKWRGDIQSLITYDIQTVMKARNDEGKKSTVATNFWNDLKNIKMRLEEDE